MKLREWKLRVDRTLAAAVDDAVLRAGTSREQWIREAIWLRLQHDRHMDRLARVERRLQAHDAAIARIERHIQAEEERQQ